MAGAGRWRREPGSRLERATMVWDDVVTAPQATSRTLSSAEIRRGLGKLGRLPRELLEVIFDILCCGHGPCVALVPVAATSRALNEIALPRLYRFVHLKTHPSVAGQFAVLIRLVHLRRWAPTHLQVDLVGYLCKAVISYEILLHASETIEELIISRLAAHTPEELPRLPPMPRLRRIDVAVSGLLTDEVLVKILPQSTTSIEEFGLRSSVKDQGTTTLDLSRLFTSQRNLRSVTITAASHINVRIAGGSALPSSYPTLRSLVFGGCALLSNPVDIVRVVTGSPNLVNLVCGDLGNLVDLPTPLPVLPLLKSIGGMASSILRLAQAVLVTPKQLDRVCLVVTGGPTQEMVALGASLAELDPVELAMFVGGEGSSAHLEAIFGAALAGEPRLHSLKVQVILAGAAEPTPAAFLAQLGAWLHPVAHSLERLAFVCSGADTPLTAEAETASLEALFKSLPNLKEVGISTTDVGRTFVRRLEDEYKDKVLVGIESLHWQAWLDGNLLGIGWPE